MKCNYERMSTGYRRHIIDLKRVSGAKPPGYIVKLRYMYTGTTGTQIKLSSSESGEEFDFYRLPHYRICTIDSAYFNN